MTTSVANKLSIKKDDQVQVIAGREKGKTGKVLRVNAKLGRVVVERVNVVKRHVRPNQANPQGGILEKESSIHYSNILLFCSKCNRGTRHGIKWIEQGGKKKSATAKKAKVRVCKRCETSPDQASS